MLSATSTALAAGALQRQQDVGEGQPRNFGVPGAILVTHGAGGLGARHAGCGEEINDVAAALIDGARFERAAIHGLHVGQQQRLGEALAEHRHDVAHAFVLAQRRADLDERDPGIQRRLRHHQSLRNIVDIHRDLERELRCAIARERARTQRAM